MTWFAQRGSGAARRPAGPSEARVPLEAGTCLIEYQHLPSGRPFNVVRARVRDPQKAGFTLRVDPCGSAQLLLSAGGHEAAFRLALSGVPAGARVLLWYGWSGTTGHLSASVVEQDRHIVQVIGDPVRFGAEEIAALMDQADLAEGAVMSAAKGCLPVGPMPGLCGAARVRMLNGELAVSEVAQGDVLMGADGAPVQVRWIVEASLPTGGVFAPAHMAAPAFGAVRDVWFGAHQRIALGGTEVEYLFSNPCVMAAAGDLTGAPPEGAQGARRYLGFVLDRDVPLLVEGLQVPGFDIRPMMSDPDLAARSVLSDMPPELWPRQGEPQAQALQPFEARSLARARAAAQVPLYGVS